MSITASALTARSAGTPTPRTIRSRPSRPARCDTADGLMPSAAAMSFFGPVLQQCLHNPCRSVVKRSKQVVPTNQRGVDRVDVGPGLARGPERGADQRQAGLALSRCRPLDGFAGGPPARAVLNARALVEHGDLTPADAEPHVDARVRRPTAATAQHRSRAPTRGNAPWNSSPTVKAGGSIAASATSRRALFSARWAPARSATVREPDDVADEGRPQVMKQCSSFEPYEDYSLISKTEAILLSRRVRPLPAGA